MIPNFNRLVSHLETIGNLYVYSAREIISGFLLLPLFKGDGSSVNVISGVGEVSFIKLSRHDCTIKDEPVSTRSLHRAPSQRRIEGVLIVA